ncbi:MAG: helix-turn-helix transcriptional regulator [Eubacterium sp.]|nr:helix-turn-helix transcriptional regulator [Eubacterium sp.]
MKNTEDFFNELNSAHSEGSLDRIISDPDINHDRFHIYFCSILDSRGIDKKELVKRLNLSRTYIYQMLNGTRLPGRDNTLALCVSGTFDLTETNHCLTLIKASALYPKDTRDAVIIYGINNKLSIDDLNVLLIKKDMKPLTE